MKVLILEDAAFDAVLIEYELEKLTSVLDCRRVDTREEFLQALEEFRPDLILADYRLPRFDGLTALALVQEECPQVPFIFVSGAMSPELAQEGLTRGAAAWVSKDRLSRLPAAVERTLGGDPGPAAAQEPDGQEGNLWRGLAQRTRKVMVVLDLNGRILEFNRGAELLTGWHRHEVLGQDLVELLVPPETQGWVQARLSRVAAGEASRGFELAVRQRHGEVSRWFCQPTRLENLQGQAEMILLVADQAELASERPTRTFTVKSRLVC